MPLPHLDDVQLFQRVRMLGVVNVADVFEDFGGIDGLLRAVVQRRRRFLRQHTASFCRVNNWTKKGKPIDGMKCEIINNN